MYGNYVLNLDYNQLSNIETKSLWLAGYDIIISDYLQSSYDMDNTYNSNNPYRVEEITGIESINEAGLENSYKKYQYRYDANGNVIYTAAEREKADGNMDEKSNERSFLWDEEDRLVSLNDNGYVSNYWYDANGKRVVKTHGENNGVYINAAFSGGYTGTSQFTAYVNPYMEVNPGGNYTKYIFAGSVRVAAKLGDLESYGADPRRITYAGHEIEDIKIDYKAKYTASQREIGNHYRAFDAQYNGRDNDDYVNGGVFGPEAAVEEADNTRGGNVDKRDTTGNSKEDPECRQYYFHNGLQESTDLVTNFSGKISQHIEYLPSGEIFIERRNEVWNTPYLFNGWEWDEITGLYHCGQGIYYDPRTNSRLNFIKR
jgi:YD repeat-containing protein